MNTQLYNGRVTVRPATRKDVENWYGFIPPMTIHALLFELDEAPAALAGISREGGGYVVFSEIRDDIDVPKTLVWRASKLVMRWAAQKRVPLVAGCMDKKSARFVERLGFRRVAQMNGMEVYQWNCS